MEGRAARSARSCSSCVAQPPAAVRRPCSDWLALLFGAFVVLYGLLPQSWLGGGATHKGVLYAARHDLLPVGAYFLGRGLQLTERERARLCHTVLATAAFVAAFGLIDVYAVPLSWWRPAAGWFHDQLGLDYGGRLGLPENFVYNAGNGVVFRRLTSMFLSPLATAYLLVVAMFFIPLRRRWGLPLGLLLFAAILWTHTRAALIALVAVLVLLAIVRRLRGALIWRVVVAVLASRVRPGLRPLRAAHALHRGRAADAGAHRAQHPQASNDATSANESSTSEHLVACATARRTVVAASVGLRARQLRRHGGTDARAVKAGESTYTELGVETGILGALVFVAWSLALLRVDAAQARWLGAAFAAVLLLGLQTDVIGVPWIAVTVWAFAGDSA